MLTLTDLTADDSGEYTLLVTNAWGSVTSQPVYLNVCWQTVPGIIFGTGVDTNGAPLPHGAVDPHYQLVSSPDPEYPGPEAVAIAPLPGWVTNAPSAGWIAPSSDPNITNSAGIYIYRTIFYVTNLDPTQIRVEGDWAAATKGLDILVNGQSTGSSSPGPGTLTHFDLTNVLSGSNTFEFLVTKDPTNLLNEPPAVIVKPKELLKLTNLELQPTNKHSRLVTYLGADVCDNEFAGMIKNVLKTNGIANVLDAKFLFQECYGGGMLDDLKSALDDPVKWVGGSASKHNEQSSGEVSPDENKKEHFDKKWEGDPPEGYWTKLLKGELGKANQTLLEDINNARNKDEVGINAPLATDPDKKPKRETGQSAYGNGGDTITLQDPAATSHHAILWGGDADHMRHFNNIKNVRDALTKAWGQPGANVTITTLFGNGTKSSDGNALPADWHAKLATKEELQKALLEAKLGTNEQFFFYASGHGDTKTDVLLDPTTVPGKKKFHEISSLEEDREMLVLSEGELIGMLLQDDNVPTLEVAYTPLTGPAHVYFNGFLLGDLSLSSTQTVFDVPEPILFATNIIEVANDSPDDFTLLSESFSTGGIDTNPGLNDGLSLLLPTWLTGGIFQFWVAGESGMTFEVQVSSNLVNWATHSTNTFAMRVFNYMDPDPSSQHLRFYRVISRQLKITASSGPNGSVSPSDTLFKYPGESQTFTAQPHTNCVVRRWFLDGTVAQVGGTNYTLTNIQTNHDVQASFLVP
jgi:hypothetical protein